MPTLGIRKINLAISYLWLFINTIVFLIIINASAAKNLQERLVVLGGLLAFNAAIWSVYIIVKYYDPRSRRY